MPKLTCPEHLSSPVTVRVADIGQAFHSAMCARACWKDLMNTSLHISSSKNSCFTVYACFEKNAVYEPYLTFSQHFQFILLSLHSYFIYIPPCLMSRLYIYILKKVSYVYYHRLVVIFSVQLGGKLESLVAEYS